MKKIWECCRLELSMMLKTWLGRILLILLMGYAAIAAIYYTPTSPGSTLSGSAYVVEAGMFLFIIIGYNMIKKEEIFSCDEVFHAMKLGRISKISGKLLALITAAFLTSTFIMCIYYFLYIIYKVPGVFFIKGVPYMILYYFIPFCILGIIGMIIGILAKGRVGYVLLVLGWMIMGITNNALVSPIVRIFKIKYEFRPLENFLNLAQTNYDNQFNIIYGLPIELTRWYQKGIIFTIFLTILLLLIVSRNGRRKLTWFVSVLVPGAIVLWMLTTQYLKPAQVIYR